jgi:serine/threonine protein kinase
VYQVRDVIGREWAMKLVRHDQVSQAAKARFFSEALAMAQLEHPNVVRVQDYHEPTTPEDVPYILMPLYPANLQQKWDEYQGQTVKVVRLLAGIADGLAYLHAKDFLHRDIKPSNVLLDVNEQPLVSDFGLVKDLGDLERNSDVSEDMGSDSADTKPSAAQRTQTMHGAIMGTKRYMSPEQANGLSEQANPNWDVWAWGVMAHELLIGEPPESSKAPHKLLDPRIPDNPKPSTLKPGLPRELERILCKALARNPQGRYSSAQELATDLHRWLNRKTKSRNQIAWTSFVLIVLTTLTLTLAMWPKKSEPPLSDEQKLERARNQLIDKLKNDGHADLIGSTDKPEYSRIAAGEAYTTQRLWGVDQTLTIDTQRVSMIELVPPEVPHSGFRLYGKIRLNDEIEYASLAGFYISHRPTTTAEGPINTFINLTVTNRLTVRFQPKFRAPNTEHMALFQLFAHAYDRDDPNGSQLLEFAGSRSVGIDKDPQVKANLYHEFKMVITPKAIQATCDDLPLALTKQPILQEGLEVMASRLRPIPSVGYSIQGGIGLYVKHASASFKDVRIELMKESVE